MSYQDSETLEKIVRLRNKTNAFSNMIGLYVTEIGPGWARARVDITPDHLNPMGTVHGGCISTMADVVGGAGASCHGLNIVTLDCHIHYLRAGRGTKILYGEAKEIRAGKNILVYDVDITDEKEEEKS